jgi:hypothetical protein
VLLSIVVSTGVEFGGYNCGQDSALKDPSIIAQPEVVLSPA